MTAAEAQTESQAATPSRPCSYCGRPVPQQFGTRRPVRFCQDTEGACEQGSVQRRLRDHASAGLAGRVADIWDLVGKLEEVAGTLARSVYGELSVPAVQRRVAEAEAAAEAEIAAAAREKESARLEVQQAMERIAYHSRRTASLENELAELRARHFEAEERDTIIRDLRTLVARLAAERDARNPEWLSAYLSKERAR